MDPARRLRRYATCALHPVAGFRAWAAEAPDLGPTFGWLLLVRGVLASLGSLLMLRSLYHDYPSFKHLQGPVWQELLLRLPPDLSAQDVRAYLSGLPDLKPWAQVWPWVLALGPVGIASAWLHNAVWDHGCLWLLGGVKRSGSWRTTFIAEAAAMQVGALEALLALLGFLPLAGPLLAPVLAAVGVYFWVMRGIALAVFHDVPPWKGALATLLHVAIAILCVCGMLGLSWLIVSQSVAL